MSASSARQSERNTVSRKSWCLAAFVMLLAANPYWMSDSAPLAGPPNASAMAPADTWDPPAATLESLRDLLTWPYWLFALVAALVVGNGAALTSKRVPPVLVSLFLIGFCWEMTPRLLIPTLCLVVVSSFLGSATSTGRWFRLLLMPVLILAVALLLTLESGLPLLLIICVWVSQVETRTLTRGRTLALAGVVTIVVSAMVVAAIVVPGFGEMLMRPVSSIRAISDTKLMPSLSSVLTPHSNWWLSGLAIAVILAVWVQRVFGRRGTIAGSVGVAILSLIAIASQRYLWLAGLTIVLLHAATTERAEDIPAAKPPAESAPFSRSLPLHRLAPLLCTAVGLMIVGGEFATNGAVSLTMSSRDRLLDPSQWGIAGRVMLTDLDHSADWQSPDSPRTCQLLMDDRWDIHRRQLDEYSRAVDDWTNWQREAYLRSDVTWGGYRDFFQQWSPDIVVVSSNDLETIRRVSINSDWPLLGIDGRRTMFGRSTNRQCSAQSAKALSLLANLECPRADREQSLEGILQLGTSADARRIADVLNAMRLPYAALRVLPEDNDPETELVRTWSYVELAHRCLQNTGRVSLLDHSRAMHGLRELESSSWLSDRGRERVQRSISSLRSTDIRSTTLTENSSNDVQQSETSVQTDQLRKALQLDGPQDVDAALTAVSNTPWHKFLQTMLTKATRATANQESQLQALVESDDFPAEFLPEAWFYLACLALESGNPAEAVAWFDQCRAAAESGPFAPLARFYLRQLITPPQGNAAEIRDRMDSDGA